MIATINNKNRVTGIYEVGLAGSFPHRLHNTYDNPGFPIAFPILILDFRSQ